MVGERRLGTHKTEIVDQIFLCQGDSANIRAKLFWLFRPGDHQPLADRLNQRISQGIDPDIVIDKRVEVVAQLEGRLAIRRLFGTEQGNPDLFDLALFRVKCHDLKYLAGGHIAHQRNQVQCRAGIKVTLEFKQFFGDLAA